MDPNTSLINVVLRVSILIAFPALWYLNVVSVLKGYDSDSVWVYLLYSTHCFDWLGTSHVLSSTLWWWWCCIMLRSLLELRLLTTFLLFFLPDLGWPWPGWTFILSLTICALNPGYHLDNTDSSTMHLWTFLNNFGPNFPSYLIPSALWTEHVGYALCSCLLCFDGLSDHDTCAIFTLSSRGHFGSGRPVELFK